MLSEESRKQRAERKAEASKKLIVKKANAQCWALSGKWEQRQAAESSPRSENNDQAMCRYRPGVVRDTDIWVANQ